MLARCLLICLGLGAPAAASTLDDYIVPGRARLFDGTASGPARACDLFAAGLADASCAESPGRRDLLFLHALARTTVLLGNPSDNVVPDGLLKWIEPFSAALASGVAHDAPDRLPAWPDANPGTIGSYTLSAQIDAIVAELESIADQPAPFVMILTPNETGLKGDLEVDYGDVLMLKGALLAYRASLQVQPLPDLASTGWVHDRRVLERLDAWIEDAPCLLGFASATDEGRGWRAYWADAVVCYLDAVAYIAAEDDPPGTDPQQDELIYIDPRSRVHLDRRMAALADPASGTSTAAGAKVYDVRDANSVRLGELVLVFDGTDTGGREGRLSLDDGTCLDIDWFGVLDAGEIGISMFSRDQTTQGWLQGAITADHNAITEAALDLWGTDTRVMAAITARWAAEAAWELPNPNPHDELLAHAGDEANRGLSGRRDALQ